MPITSGADRRPVLNAKRIPKKTTITPSTHTRSHKRNRFDNNGSPCRHRAGFSLVVTLLLMILLSTIAVGLLGLSAVSMRFTGMHDAQAQARANARLALMLAIGELQKTAGKDTAVTAPSDLTLPVGSGQRHLTGVWDSWPVPVSGSPDYPGEKDQRFRGWLVSDADPAKVKSKDYPQTAPINPVELYRQDPSSNSGRVAAGLVKLGTTGDYAWHVADESTKIRIDQLRNPDHGFHQNSTRYQRRSLLAGHRPGLRKLQAVQGYDFSKLPNDKAGGGSGGEDLTRYRNALPVMGKLTSLSQVDLLGPGKIPPALRHELTVGTLGVLSDAAAGGLKKDLSTAFGVVGGLPPELAGQRVYQSTHGTSGISDPYWSNLSSYHNLYARSTNTLTADQGWNTLFTSTGARDGTSTSPPPAPKEYQLAPVILRVDLNFSVFTRSPQPHWQSPRQYNLYMTCNPVVVLHNPYTSQVSFERFTVVIEEPPLLFKFSGTNLGHFRSSGPWQPSPLPNSPLPLGHTCGSDYFGGNSPAKVNERSAIRLEFPGQTRPASLTLGGGRTMYVTPEIVDSKKPSPLAIITKLWGVSTIM